MFKTILVGLMLFYKTRVYLNAPVAHSFIKTYLYKLLVLFIYNILLHVSAIMNYSPLTNNTMATHFPFFTEILHDSFTTEKDNIHLMATTAKSILTNWLLNLQQ